MCIFPPALVRDETVMGQRRDLSLLLLLGTEEESTKNQYLCNRTVEGGLVLNKGSIAQKSNFVKVTITLLIACISQISGRVNQKIAFFFKKIHFLNTWETPPPLHAMA